MFIAGWGPPDAPRSPRWLHERSLRDDGASRRDARHQLLLAVRGHPGDRPPGDPGMVKVSVPEARRLARLAAAPMTRAARETGYAWSRWRRRHQARARWHHYRARLKAAAHPP